MFRFRFLIVLTLGFLAASAAWADEVGYVDCSNHSDATQVFGKPRRSPDVVASLACGERFTILVYGFYFSRIQTKDGQIGYIYSSLIAVDRGAAAVQQTPSLQAATEKAKIPSTRYTEASVNPAPAQPQPAAHQQAPATPAGFPTPASVSSTSSSPAAAADTSASSAPAASTSIPNAPAATAAPSEPPAAAPAPAETQPAAKPEITLSAPASNPPEVSAPAAQPNPVAPTAQPDQPAPAPAPAAATAEPAAAQPAPEPTPAQPTPARPAPAIRPVDTRETWEKPNPSVRTPPLLEFFGGFAFNRMGNGGGYSSTNFNGALGSFAYNFKPWLQIVADTSYNYDTVSGTKTVLYGNHYGPRYYYRGLSRLHITPFAEAFIGGSRADVTASGSTTSQNCISYKVGGGIDYRASRRWEIRLFDFDYYRTSFGTNAHQTNYWASTGVVLRLFGGGSE
jgi:hypothetical protein